MAGSIELVRSALVRLAGPLGTAGLILREWCQCFEVPERFGRKDPRDSWSGFFDSFFGEWEKVEAEIRNASQACEGLLESLGGIVEHPGEKVADLKSFLAHIPFLVPYLHEGPSYFELGVASVREGRVRVDRASGENWQWISWLQAIQSGRGPEEDPQGRPQVVSSAGHPSAERVFRREGNVWYVRFDDEETRLRNLRGLEYLQLLLAKPGEVIGVDELDSAGRWSKTDGDRVLDAPARKALTSRQENLQSEISAAREAGELDQVEDLEAEQAQIRRQLLRASGGGRGPQVLDDEGERRRSRVGKAIKSALKAIEAELPALGQHLRQSLEGPTGLKPSYRPPSGSAPWNVGEAPDR